MAVIYKFLLLLSFLAFADAKCNPSLVDPNREEFWLTWLPWVDKTYDWGMRMYAEPNCAGEDIYYWRSMTLISKNRIGDCRTLNPNITVHEASLVTYTKTRADLECQLQFFSDQECTDLLAETDMPDNPSCGEEGLGPSDSTFVGVPTNEYYVMVPQVETKFGSFWAQCFEKEK